MNINYSFIIPHKNSPQLLQRCIASIPQREDVQIIVVDDNSDKKVVDWESLSLDKGKSIELILTTEGGGAGYARNVGLSHAKGKWVLFIDSDDTFTEGLSRVLDKYKYSDSDVVYFNYNRLDCGNVKLCSVTETKDEDASFRLKYGNTAPWNKMVKLEFLREHHIHFEECPVGNDIFYTYQVGYFVRDNFALEDIAVYNYFTTSGSITRKKKNSEDYYLTICKHIYQCNAFYKFLGTKKRRGNMMKKFAAIFIKKGIGQMFFAMWVYFSHYDEIKNSKNYFIDNLGKQSVHVW